MSWLSWQLIILSHGYLVRLLGRHDLVHKVVTGWVLYLVNDAVLLYDYASSCDHTYLCRTHLNVITGPHNKRRAVGTLNVPQQLTLPDVGVVTSTASSSNKSLELTAPHASKPVELAASQSVRVRVENRLLLVPVPMPEQQTIAWLAREAARRYCRLVQVSSYNKRFGELWHLHFLLHPYCEPNINSNNN